MVTTLERRANHLGFDQEFSDRTLKIAKTVLQRDCRRNGDADITEATADMVLDYEWAIGGQRHLEPDHARKFAGYHAMIDISQEWGVPEETELVLLGVQRATIADNLGRVLAAAASPGLSPVEVVDGFIAVVEKAQPTRSN